MARPICFMVMPFGRKTTGLGPDGPGPAQVDFDALWEKAFAPVIESRGYEPVRADQDVGALIVVEMIRRLALSDLVVADITIPNANVYYEIGVRHAARPDSCVLLAADWAQPLFDVQQMPRLTYSLADGDVSDETARAIVAQIETQIEELRAGASPVYQAVPGYPGDIEQARVEAFKSEMLELNALLARFQAVRRMWDPEQAKAAALELRGKFDPRQGLNDGVAMEMMYLLRDHVGWQEMRDWIDALPPRLRDRAGVQEQRMLATGKYDEPLVAIAELELLIATTGDSSERQGILGGRYKELWREAQARDRVVPAEVASHLDKAIEHYENGMRLDLNDYYPSCNLPRLYRARGREGDADRARTAAAVTLVSCDRARRLGSTDVWLPQTLLGAAFDAQDAQRARELAAEVQAGNPAAWKLETTVGDLRLSTTLADDDAAYAELAVVFNELNDLLPEAQREEPLDPAARPG